ncbi:MAG TPA: Na+/H+ antiporter NhaA [Acidimicrobiales bacterium]|nr:Na+/H+ antiporter NhaA [Acidimicrobiales bacterium]
MARPVAEYLQIEGAGGFALVSAAALALLLANSPWHDMYNELWATEVGIRAGGLELEEDLRHWVNDGLMVLFFFVVGLEIKTELVSGELARARRAAVPVAAAAGGMLAPALVYLSINADDHSSGWGVPVATDIAFALSVVGLLGERVPQPLKVLLLGLAIVDDVGAVLIIALFYTESLSVGWLGAAGALTLLVVLLRSLHVSYLPFYAVVGVGVWLATLESGVHATIAGVVLGLLAPARPLVSRDHVNQVVAEQTANHDAADLRDVAVAVRQATPVAERLKDGLHPWTSFLVVPTFALANAGVTFDSERISDAATSPVTLGVIAGLLVGKPAGILGAIWLVTHLTRAEVPPGSTWRHLAGLGTVAGIGFTMSLFIAGLAFGETSEQFEQAKLGIFAASAAAGTAGGTLLWTSRNRV